MNGAITRIALRPDQEQKILSITVLMQLAGELAGGLRRWSSTLALVRTTKKADDKVKR
jgi:hypothetical protein